MRYENIANLYILSAGIALITNGVGHALLPLTGPAAAIYPRKGAL